MNILEHINYEAYAKSYDEKFFWDKLGGVAKRLGREVVENALLLFYAAQNPRTPPGARTTIYGALAYLVLQLDATPDFIPMVGLSDDADVIAAALGASAGYIDADVEAKAAEKLTDWFDA